MRITSNMIHAKSVMGMSQNTTKLYKAIEQAASGKRVNTPSDDPLASTLALGVQQSKTTNLLYRSNQKSVDSSLKTVEAQLASVGDALHSVRNRLIEAGSGVFSDSDIRTISYDLKELQAELLGLANTKDSQGNYLFSGYQSSLQPFVSNNNQIIYYGDQGQRVMQVGENRYMPTTYHGDEIFMTIPTGNGYLTAIDNLNNRGSGVITPNGVYNVEKWNQSSQNFSILFAVDASTLEPDGPIYKYDIIDNVTGNSILTGQPSVGTPDNPGAYWREFTPGDTIYFSSQEGDPIDFDYGFSVTIDGQPTPYLLEGQYYFDEFTIEAASSQSIFDTLSDLIARLESPKNTLSDPTPWDDDPSTSGNAAYMNAITQALLNVDNALDNVLRVRTEIGTHLNEVESLMNTAQDLDLIYSDNLSAYLDADYATTISDYARYKVYLEAAQKTFAQISQLSLFNYI